jgi:hypothetical protein
MKSSTLTHAEAIDRFGIPVEAEFTADDPIPVLTGLQFQGDVAIIPAALADTEVPAATGNVPMDGIPVVRGENGGNTHLLLHTEGVTFDPVTEEGLVIGRLTVAEDATAYLAHPEHGYAGIGTGTYQIRRQREQAEQERLVRD